MQSLDADKESLRASEERFRILIEGVKDYAIFMLDPAGNVLIWNSGAERIIGYNAQEAIGKNQALYYPPDDIAEGKPQRELEQAELLGSLNEEGWRVRKGGAHFWSHGVLTALYDGSGKLRGFAKVTRDLTERKLSEEKLRSSEERLRFLIEGVKDYAIFMLDPVGNVLTWNSGAELIFGYKAAQVIGEPYSQFFQSEHSESGHEQCCKELELAAERGTLEITGWRIRRDGSKFWANGTLTALYDANLKIRGFAKITRDLSEHRKLESQLHQSQKMQAFGQLAGGVAHDFNNLLTVINGYSELMLSQFGAEDPMRKHLEEIRRAGDRAASLTRQLLAFSRQQILEPKVLNLNSLVSGTETMLRRLIGEDVQMSVVLSPTLEPVRVDPGQIEQVIINLVVNARDAMPQGGKISIETQNVDLDDTYTLRYADCPAGRYVLLAISDMGCGMTAEVKSHIFEPFYTTKGVGKGTGLGLAVVQGIVNQSKGNIEVYSEVGFGSSFKIYLPAIQDRPSESTSSRTSKPPVGNETILVVEDETAVRQLTSLALKSCGYTVLQASSGKEALQLMQTHPERIDLLLTDVVMPEMSGGVLAEAVAVFAPKMKVLFVSGYMDDAVFRHGILHEKVTFLQKPFTVGALARKVRDLLDHHR